MLFTTDCEDGADLACWPVGQPWSDGQFVVAGDSVDCFAAHLMAAARPEGLVGGFIQVSCGDLLSHGVVRETGGLQLERWFPGSPWRRPRAGPTTWSR